MHDILLNQTCPVSISYIASLLSLLSYCFKNPILAVGGHKTKNVRSGYIIIIIIFRENLNMRDLGDVLTNTLRPRQNGRHFPDDIFKWIFLNENV